MQNLSWIRKINFTKIIFWFIILYFSILMLKITFQYFPMKTDVGFIRTKERFFEINFWKYIFFTHVYVSVFALIAGLTQFSKNIQIKFKKIHRIYGYVYVAIILLLAAPSGFIISFYANGGWVAQSAFVILSVLWWLTTLFAILHAKNKNWKKHEYWMIRSYALTFSAVTLRGWKVILVPLIEASPMEFYRFVAWVSWTLNLCVAEFIIHRKKMVQKNL